MRMSERGRDGARTHFDKSLHCATNYVLYPSSVRVRRLRRPILPPPQKIPRHSAALAAAAACEKTDFLEHLSGSGGGGGDTCAHKRVTRRRRTPACSFERP